MCLWNTNALVGNTLVIFSIKIKAKVQRSLTLVSHERISLVEYTCQIWKSQSLTIQKLCRRLKVLATDILTHTQTNRQDKNYMIPNSNPRAYKAHVLHELHFTYDPEHGYVKECLKSSLRKSYGRYGDSVVGDKLVIFSIKIKAKVPRSLTLVSHERISLVEYTCQTWKSQSLTVQKLCRRLKVLAWTNWHTHRQTDRTKIIWSQIQILGHTKRMFYTNYILHMIPNMDTSRNAWNRHWGSHVVDTGI